MKVQCATPREIPSPGPSARYEKRLLRSTDGVLFLGGPGLISGDGGHDWDLLPGLSAVCAECAPGEVVSLQGGISGLRPANDPGDFLGDFVRYSGTGNELERFTGTFHIPRAAGMYDDGGTYHPEPFVDHGFVITASDLWILSLYGVLQSDVGPENLSSYSRYPLEWGEWKYRTYCVASADQGHSWTHLATVARGSQGGWEGFCEPALADLGGDALVCLMRNGEHGKPGESLWQARSADAGATWTDVHPLVARGVYPQLARGAAGCLLAGYGRPGWRVMLSMDGRGESWSHHTTLPLPSGSGYCAVAEMEADRFLFVYAWDPAAESPPALGAVELTLTRGSVSCMPPQAMAAPGATEVTPTRGGVGSVQPHAHLSCVGMNLVHVPWGAFTMGSPTSERGRDPKEGIETPHTVTISRDFQLGAAPVTNAQYGRFCAESSAPAPNGTRMQADGLPQFDFHPWSDPAFSAANLPVVCVSWEEAGQFCAWLTATEGRTCRLPTEAEWEYACRAGTCTAYWWGAEPDPGQAHYDTRMAWCGAPVPAAAAVANPWGLHGMLGNVGEWCQDTWDVYTEEPQVDPRARAGGYRIWRGGAWNYPAHRIRCASRCSGKENSRLASVGFRVLVEID